MKKAVIRSGNSQYFVSEGQVIEVDLLPEAKTIEFEPLLIIEDDKINVGVPIVAGAKVKAEIVDQMIKGEKILAIRYKAKKRVRKVHGHRQQSTKIKISSINTK